MDRPESWPKSPRRRFEGRGGELPEVAREAGVATATAWRAMMLVEDMTPAGEPPSGKLFR